MSLEKLDTERVRKYLETREQFLLTHPNPHEVRASAIGIARSITPEGGRLLTEAQRLPVTQIVGTTRSLEAGKRSDRFDSALKEYVEHVYEALDAIEHYQSRIKENAPLARSQYRARVLLYAVNQEQDLLWSGDVAWALGLTQNQTLDAIEHWGSLGAIIPGEQIGNGQGEIVWNFSVTSRGRDIADELGSEELSEPAEQHQIDARTVFLVHGRDLSASRAMSELLRALGLAPMDWSQAVALTGKPSPYINEVLQAALNVAQAIVILLTPDNESRLREDLWSSVESEDEKQLRFHPRQNVLYEAGMAFGMAEKRTVVVRMGPVLIASDLHGLSYVTFSGDASSRVRLSQRLIVAGCAVDSTGEAWLHSGNFPSYAHLSIGTSLGMNPPAPLQEAEVSERAFMVQPRFHLSLHSGTGGPDGHYLVGVIRNVGRGIACEPNSISPALATS
jgi:predicted nucleotide-binding protein